MQESLPQRLRVLRARKGWNLRDAARRAEIGRDTLSDIERGRQVPQMATLARLAKAYGVPTEELSELLLEEEPVPLPEAPKASGRAEPSEADREEEERRVIRQSAESLKGHIEFAKKLKEEREREMQEVVSGAVHPRDTWIFTMEAQDSYLRRLLELQGVQGFVEAVKEGREFAEPEAVSHSHKLLRHLAYLEALTAEARTLRGKVSSEVHEEAVKGTSRLESLAQEESERRGR